MALETVSSFWGQLWMPEILMRFWRHHIIFVFLFFPVVNYMLSGYSNISTFDSIFRSNKVRMISPVVHKGHSDHMCFSFWFAAFGAGDTTSLRIYRQDHKGGDDSNDNNNSDNSPMVWFHCITVYSFVGYTPSVCRESTKFCAKPGLNILYPAKEFSTEQ